MKICIFLFSGTGLTKYVIEKIKNELENRQVAVSVFLAENAEIENIDFNKYNLIGFSYPVHSFNAPKIVFNFVEKLPKIKQTKTFIISTAGGDSPLNSASSKMLVKILSNKGFDVFYDRIFVMPSNFIVKDNAAAVQFKIKTINGEAPGTADDIINLVHYKQNAGLSGEIAAFLGRLEWLGLAVVGRFFHAENNCSGCAICVDNCPNNNIVLNAEKAKFNRHCGLCMRCLYICPKNCIKPKRPYKIIGFDKWYDNEEFTISSLIK